jgi:hypothetical protein
MSTQMDPEDISTSSKAEAIHAKFPAAAWKSGDPERRRLPEKRKVHSDRVLAFLRKFPNWAF